MTNIDSDTMLGRLKRKEGDKHGSQKESKKDKEA